MSRDVLHVTLEREGSVLKRQRLTAALLGAQQPNARREPQRFSRAPVLRALDGELVVCVQEGLRVRVEKMGHSVGVEAYRSFLREDPEFPSTLALPIPRDGETVVERGEHTIRMRWGKGRPSVFTPSASARDFDSPYWNAFGFSLLAHAALVVTALVYPVVDFDLGETHPLVEYHAATFVPVPPKPRPEVPQATPSSASRPRLKGETRRPVSDFAWARLQTLDSGVGTLIGRSRGLLQSLGAKIQGPAASEGAGLKVRGAPSGTERRAGLGTSLAPGDLPMLATGPVPPRRLRRSVPREPLVIGSPVTVGSLPRAVIERVISDNKAQVRACFERALQRDHDLEGRIAMRWLIGRDGRVARVQVSSDTLRDKSVGHCLRASIAAWRFPAPAAGGTVEVRYPFVFRSH